MGAAVAFLPEPNLSGAISKSYLRLSHGHAYVVSKGELKHLPEWRRAFQNQIKDHRYYRLIDETLSGDFQISYLILEDVEGRRRAIQPFFLLQQDLVAGLGQTFRMIVERIRKHHANFLKIRMLLVGCVAGAGHLDSTTPEEAHWVAQALHEVLPLQAQKDKVSVIVLKEFPSFYRTPLSCFSQNGYARVPSMPNVELDLQYTSFDDYMAKGLSKSMRKNLRRKFKKVAQSSPIEFQVVHDLTPYIDEVYPLYLQVYERATMKFEKLTKDYLSRLGQDMPERARFFIWRQSGRVVAFSVCLVQGETISDEYIGLEYPTALDLHLYFYTLRNIIQWAIENGYKTYYSTCLNYDPKLHMGCSLCPVDLYVTHRSPLINFFFRRVVRFLEPTHRDPILQKFSNAHEL